MLSELFINNIAVIEHASIELSEGFTVMTGETGAGKSIIIDAINAVLGERASKELIRSGETFASVSAFFTDIDSITQKKLIELGIEPEEDNSLLIKRDIRLKGKSSCKINGNPATVSMLKEIGSSLVSIHGQHESYDLLSNDLHLRYLDLFSEHSLEEYQCCYWSLRETQKQLMSLNTDEAEKARQMDLLKYQIDELETANIRIGEQEELMREREVLRNLEKMLQSLNNARQLLSGTEGSSGIASDISDLTSELEKLSGFFPAAEDALNKIYEISSLILDIDSKLYDINIDSEDRSLDEIEERLEFLYRIGLKYGDSEEKVLDFLESCKKQLKKIEFSDIERSELENKYEIQKQRAIKLAKELSFSRQKLSLDFSKKVMSELKFLDMPEIQFVVSRENIPLNSFGCDRIEFLVSTNIGEPPKPISKIASGGELSRIMLAIKTVLAGRDKIETLIFDEVDAGISGEAAVKVGKKLKQVAQNRQVICITHLAQIAALADHHMQISKHSDAERTYTKVLPLHFDQRKKELARIIGGNDLTETKLKMAEEMINST